MTKSMTTDPHGQMIEDITRQWRNAKTRRNQWHALWQDCYDYALPNYESFSSTGKGRDKMAHLYDGTALDCVEQLAASLLGNLTPPWSQWFGFVPGPDLPKDDVALLAPALEKAGRLLQSNLDRSNFTTEVHQAFLDVIVGGTATLLFEESPIGGYSAFRFRAVPLSNVALSEGDRTGHLDTVFHETDMTLGDIQTKFPDIDIPSDILAKGMKTPETSFPILETITPNGLVYHYNAFFILDDGGDDLRLIQSASLNQSPFIAFRWMKSPGEIYGRSPVMKALPDIKTANKVVELILKNASIAVSGVWQADDDGVINLSNIDLTPGSIIPKAVGSKGLTPLEMPSNFDVSQLVLDDLRTRIRHALMADRLGAIGQRQMTATEVLERSAEMALLIGASYGRMQTELLTPLLKRAYNILRRRGEVPDIDIDGRLVTIDYRSPLALGQGQNNVQNILYWINSTRAMGAQAETAIDLTAAARHLGKALGVPNDLIAAPVAVPTDPTPTPTTETNPQ